MDQEDTLNRWESSPIVFRRKGNRKITRTPECNPIRQGAILPSISYTIYSKIVWDSLGKMRKQILWPERSHRHLPRDRSRSMDLETILTTRSFRRWKPIWKNRPGLVQTKLKRIQGLYIARWEMPSPIDVVPHSSLQVGEGPGDAGTEHKTEETRITVHYEI